MRKVPARWFNSIPGAHVVEGRRDSQKLSSCGRCSCSHCMYTQQISKCKKKRKITAFEPSMLACTWVAEGWRTALSKPVLERTASEN